jgi:hypothetical protein
MKCNDDLANLIELEEIVSIGSREKSQRKCGFCNFVVNCNNVSFSQLCTASKMGPAFALFNTSWTFVRSSMK